jgi:hypothetical protein
MEIEIITNFEKIHPQKILEMLGNKFYLTKSLNDSLGMVASSSFGLESEEN